MNEFAAFFFFSVIVTCTFPVSTMQPTMNEGCFNCYFIDYGSTEAMFMAMTPVGQFKVGCSGQLAPNVAAKVSATDDCSVN